MNSTLQNGQITSTIHPAFFREAISYEVQAPECLDLGLDGPSKTPSDRRL